MDLLLLCDCANTVWCVMAGERLGLEVTGLGAVHLDRYCLD